MADTRFSISKDVSFFIMPCGNRIPIALYRAIALKEQLQYAGFSAHVVNRVEDIPPNQVVILQRVLLKTDEMRWLHHHARLVFFDIDDYVINAAEMPKGSRPSVEWSAAMTNMILEVGKVLCSTQELANVLKKELTIDTWVRRNQIWQECLRLGVQAGGCKAPYIGYPAGTSTHVEDFYMVEEPLSEILTKHRKARLVLVGEEVASPEFKRKWRQRMDIYPLFKDFKQYLLFISRLAIVITPLQRSKFNRCKSFAKVLEAGIMGVPVVASDVGQYSDIVEHEKSGMIAATPKDWVASLDYLLANSMCRRALGKQLRDKILAGHTTKDTSDIDKIFLREESVSKFKTSVSEVPRFEPPMLPEQFCFKSGGTVQEKSTDSSSVKLGRTSQELVSWSWDQPNPIFVPFKGLFDDVVPSPPEPASTPLQKSVSTPAIKTSKKRGLRILNYRWHCGHQWELHHLPHTFVLAHGPTSLPWDYPRRPLRSNVTVEPEKNLDFNSFDIAILHFDETVLSPHKCGGWLSSDWGEQFKRWMVDLKIPKVAICHGTVPRKGRYIWDYKKNPWEIDEDERKKIVAFLGDTLVICNSKAAQRDWQFKRSTVIYHGFEASEYPLGSRRKGIICGAGHMESRPWYRGWPFLERAINSHLDIHYLSSRPQRMRNLHYVSVPEPKNMMMSGNNYATKKFELYKKFLGLYAIYFNPTWFSPMPRTRAEAMLLGLCPVTTSFQDEDSFLQQGVTGFFSQDPLELTEFLQFCLRRPEVVWRIGSQARALATTLFSRRLYLSSWDSLLTQELTSPSP